MHGGKKQPRVHHTHTSASEVWNARPVFNPQEKTLSS